MCFVVILAILRARRRRLEWRNQPGLAVVSHDDPDFIAPREMRMDAGGEGASDPDRHTTDRGAIETGVSPEDGMTPVVHSVLPDVAEFLIPDFRPNLDICEVDLRYPDIDFAHWRAPGMAAMMFTDGAETLTVFFEGLDVIPLAGVFVRFVHPRNGPQTYLLSDLLDVDESEISYEEAAFKIDARRDLSNPENGPDARPLAFHNFDTARECIEVFVPQDRLAKTAVSISSTPDGSDALVLVDGHVAAILVGAVDAGPRNIKLVASQQIVAA
jgi:hypothetical protein